MRTSSANLSDRRRFVRNRYSRLCRVSVDGTSFDGWCTDLALRGIRMQWDGSDSPPPLEVGQRVSISIPGPLIGDHPHRTLRLGGRVRWIREDAFGVEFTLLSLDALSFLRSALAFRSGNAAGREELKTFRRLRDPESSS